MPADQGEVRGARDPALLAARGLLVASALGLASLHLLEPSYAASTATVSEYALSSSSWAFTTSLVCLAVGSALVLRRVWTPWTARRWLLLVWTVGTAVVAVLPTDPAGASVTPGGAVHGGAATAGIACLLVAEVVGAVVDVGRRAWSGAAGATALLALALSPVTGFGAAERIVIAVHIAWLVMLTVEPPPRR